jgi:hypothetical protein
MGGNALNIAKEFALWRLQIVEGWIRLQWTGGGNIGKIFF